MSTRRTVAVIAAAAAVALSVPGTASADDEDNVLYSELNLPESIPGADGTGENTDTAWTPRLIDDEEEDEYVTATLTVTAHYADGSEPDLVMGSNDDRCEDGRTELVCTEEKFHAGTTEFDLYLRPDADGEYRDEPIIFESTFICNDFEVDTQTGEVIVGDGSEPDIVDFDLPDEIPADGGSVPLPVTINGNDNGLAGWLIIELTGKDDESLPLGLEAGIVQCEGERYDFAECGAYVEPGESYTLDLAVTPMADDMLGYAKLTINVFEDDGDGDSIAEYVDETEVVKGGSAGDADILPKTGVGLTWPLAGGAGAILLAGVLLLAARRKPSDADA